MIKLLCIGIVFSIVVIDYCVCKLSSEISAKEEKQDLYTRISKL